jgi:hypothetical protein
VSNSNRASALSRSSRHSDWEGTQSVTAWLAEQSKEMRKWHENLLEAVERNNYNLLLRVEGLAQKSHSADLFQSWGESKIRENLIDALLDKLYYEELSDRHDRISTPFPKTFDWILESGGDSDPKARAPTNFKDWLSSENAIYWISGKAGSGKSTLMKSTYHDPRTKSLLLNWSGDTPLIMVPFFFWNSGTKLQMSQEGLLRSILFQALSQRKALSAKSLPSKWDAFSLSLTYSAGFGIPKPWKWTELAQALRFLVEGEDDIPVKYVFFIDGLDELDGETSKLISLIDRLTQYKNVKVCVSSRPWVEFEDTFGSGPTVKLHEHTTGDIAHYVQANLANNPAFRELVRGKPEYATTLVDNITSKASGVFLWVILVVRSMLDGMRDGDRISDLQRRLDELPEELDALFKKMLGSQKPGYLRHACQIFEIFGATRTPPTVLTLSFADEENDEYASERGIEALSDEEVYYRATTMKRRLNSRCRGLLEIAPIQPDPLSEESEADVSKQAAVGGQSTPTKRPASDPDKHSTSVKHAHLLANSKVEYMHRTVRDFFAQVEIQAYLRNHCPATFDPNACACRSYVLQLKTLSPQAVLVPQGSFWFCLRWALEHAIAIAATNTDLHIRLLDVVDQAAILQSTRKDTGASLVQKYHSKGDYHWSSLLPRAEHDDDFVTFAVRCQLIQYVKQKLASEPLSTERITRLLHAAISSHESPFLGWKRYTHPDAELVEFLLSSGADPNMEVRGSTSLQNIVYRTTPKMRTYDPTWCEVIESHKKRGVVIDNDPLNAAKGRLAEQSSSLPGRSCPGSHWFEGGTGGHASSSQDALHYPPSDASVLSMPVVQRRMDTTFADTDSSDSASEEYPVIPGEDSVSMRERTMYTSTICSRVELGNVSNPPPQNVSRGSRILEWLKQRLKGRNKDKNKSKKRG